MSEFKGTIFETISSTRVKFSTKPGESVSTGSLVEIRDSDGKKYLGRVISIQRKKLI